MMGAIIANSCGEGEHEAVAVGEILIVAGKPEVVARGGGFTIYLLNSWPHVTE